MMNKYCKKDKNIFQRFCEINDYLEDIRADCEKEVRNFIDEIWNPKLEYYVECEYTNLLTIMVCDGIDKEKFEQFVINPICENYDAYISYVEISYVEPVENKEPYYIEWGLHNINMKELEDIDWSKIK